MELVAVKGRAQPGHDDGVHLARFGMALQRQLGEQQLAVQGHLEPAAAAWQQGHTGDPGRPSVEKLSRQTGGSIGVVSDDAELDGEVHD